MGYKVGPEILQMITSAIAGVTTVVGPLRAAIPLVRIDVWIDDIRSAGSKSDVTLWEVQVLRNADSCHTTMGEDRESGTTQYTFLGVLFDHTRRAVSLSESLSGLYARHAGAQLFGHRGNGGHGVTLCIRGCHFGHVFTWLLPFHQGSATKIIRT
ncbi:hypothetical protein C3747_287g21 [Trypanosoma cruzi]|uniref:Target of rapamycin (TOR) kinase 1 n=1 Tax=Trypanosoma cruzi TaxID=5693 RepID=A0A2V2VFD8_TRYCR|nr:hypothetical protein C3747_287g21 [Trypanosoma cruzi]